MTFDSSDAIDHLFTAATRERIGRSAYGDWRSIARADAVSLSFGFPDLSCLPTDGLLEAFEAVLASDGPQALQYGGGETSELLAPFIRERARDHGDIGSDHEVVVTNGATHAVDTACRAFLEPEDVILVEGPTFMGVMGVFWNYGVDIVSVPVDDDGLDVDQLAEGLASGAIPSPKLLYTIPTFHNPTGTTMPAGRRERLVELAVDYDFAIIEDNAYGELRYDGNPEPALTALDSDGRVVQTGSFSKTVAPGVRLGWILAEESLAETLGSLAPGGTNTFTRSIVGHYCDSGAFADALPTLRETYARKRDRLLAALDRHMPPSATWTDPEGGFFLWVELDEEIDTAELLPTAAEAGVTYLPGEMFFPNGGGEHGMRLSFSYADLDDIDRGVEVLAEVIRDAA